MARRSIGSLPFSLAALLVFSGVGACTSILGDFTLKPGDGGGVPVGEAGPPADAPTSTVDASGDGPPVSDFLIDANQVATGDRHTCAIRQDRLVYCWGDNSKGQLGTTSPGGDKRPLRVASVTNAHAIVAGANHTCALSISASFAQGGQVWCWGDNTNGRLGDLGFTQPKSETPVQVKTAPGVVLNGIGLLAAGRDHTCAADNGGAVVCWGSNLAGQLGVAPTGGDNPTPKQPSPTQITRALGAGANFTCSVGTVGTNISTICWGTNDNRQLGLGAAGTSTYSGPNPVQYSGAASTVNKRLVAAGFTHACSLDENQNVDCWGSNFAGESGSNVPPGPGVKIDTAVRVPIINLLTIAAGEQVTCGINKINKVLCWGRNENGQLGTGAPGGGQALPQEVKDLTDMGALSVGTRHACAIKKPLVLPGKQDDGVGPIFCWGSGGDNRLGTGKIDPSASPVPVLKPL